MSYLSVHAIWWQLCKFSFIKWYLCVFSTELKKSVGINLNCIFLFDFQITLSEICHKWTVEKKKISSSTSTSQGFLPPSLCYARKILAPGSIYSRSSFCQSLRKPSWSWIVPCQDVDLNQEKMLWHPQKSVLFIFSISIPPQQPRDLVPQAWPGSCMCTLSKSFHFLNKPFPPRAEPCSAICWALCLPCSCSRGLDVGADWERSKGPLCRIRAGSGLPNRVSLIPWKV